MSEGEWGVGFEAGWAAAAARFEPELKDARAQIEVLRAEIRAREAGR